MIRKTTNRSLWSGCALLVILAGACRFFAAGLWPAMTGLRGDFGAVFPTASFAGLRPDFPTAQVWPGWYYGPMLHFLTLPLFLAPSWSAVPAIWAMVNLAAIVLSFVLVCRLTRRRSTVPASAVAALGGMWLLYQPLANCYAQGNVEILEMAAILGALVLLPRANGQISGLLIGFASMMKFLPVGFLIWLAVKRQWRAVVTGTMTIMAVAILAEVTLGWSNNRTLRDLSWAAEAPIGGPHESSVTSLFLHRSSVLDRADHVPRWLPSSRAVSAARAGAIASMLLVAGFGVAFLGRRSRPVAAPEIAVLFVMMFMILPWNHDYYYVFALVPISIVFLEGVARRHLPRVVLAVVGFLLISPPIPFRWLDQTGWFAVPFAHFYNFHDIPLMGGLMVWCAATHLMLTDRPAAAPLSADPGSTRLYRLALGAAGMLAASLFLVGLSERASQARQNRLRASNETAHSVPFEWDNHDPTTFALSSDGDRIAYVDTRDGMSRVCVRRTDRLHVRCVAARPGAADPFFSPDGRWIGFFAEGLLLRVPSTGGAAEVICAAPGGTTAHWADDGTILFSLPVGIARVQASGGQPKVMTRVDATIEGSHLWPQMLSRASRLLFTTVPRGAYEGTVTTLSLRTGQRQAVLIGGRTYYDEISGRLLYTRSGRLLAVPFDLAKGEPTGTSVPLASGLLATSGRAAQFAASKRGTVLYAAAQHVSATAPRLHVLRNWSTALEPR